jgi:hypothetical protein
LFFFAVSLFAQYKAVEIFQAYYTTITLCTDKKGKSYTLINNGYADFPEYLVIFTDDNYSARQCYGEVLLSYYHIKNMKKEIAILDGEFYSIPQDNSEEEIAFLRALTDSFVLQDYPSFFFIDKNSSKKEAIEFYDNFEGENKEDEIGSSAGILMGIKASDFITMLQEIKK